MGRFLVMLLCVPLLPVVLSAQEQSYIGTTTRPKVSDYPASQSAGDVAIGAEYMVRSITDGKSSYVCKDYLVVEVAVYPGQDKKVNISSNAFSLRMNGKKQELQAQAPGMVAASLKYSDWEMRPTLAAEAGLGGGTVILGRRQPSERFPGDQRPEAGRLPNPPTTPTQTPGGVEREVPVTAHDMAVWAALPDGETVHPVSGFLYFAWRGKPKSIRSLELIYRGPGGTATVLKLI